MNFSTSLSLFNFCFVTLFQNLLVFSFVFTIAMCIMKKSMKLVYLYLAYNIFDGKANV